MTLSAVKYSCLSQTQDSLFYVRQNTRPFWFKYFDVERRNNEKIGSYLNLYFWVVKANHHRRCSSIITRSDRLESLRAGRVPHLQREGNSQNVELLHFEIHSDCGLTRVLFIQLFLRYNLLFFLPQELNYSNTASSSRIKK